MKTVHLLIALALTTPLLAAEKSSAVDAGTSAGERRPPERVELKVLKVYSAQDGEAIFRAYVVEWKGQEVVVSDTLAKTKFNVGDMVGVLVMNHPFPQGKENYRLLHFAIVPPR